MQKSTSLGAKGRAEQQSEHKWALQVIPWCYGHMALSYLYVPIREESITAPSGLPMKQEHLYRRI